jgi:acyl carrier protein
VFHFAGVLDNGLIENQSPAHLERVFAPKVRGAWNLHRASADDPLEHFILFSSAAAALGSPGQVNHAAANAFLDALASYRHTLGRPALSINWGPWSRIGSAQDIKHQGILSGIGMIEPALGLAFLQDQLQRPVILPQIVAMELDCSKLPDHVRDLPMFEQLWKLSRERVDVTIRSSEFRQRYDAAPEAARRPMLLAHLRSLVAGALGMNDPTAVRADEALFDLGLDSLTSLEVRNQVQTSLQIDVPSTILFDYPTPNALADQLGKLMLPGIEKVESRTGMPSKDAVGSHPLPNQDLTNVTESASDAGETETGRNGTRIELDKLMESIHELSDDLASWADDAEEVS